MKLTQLISLDSEISESLGLDIQGRVSSGLGLVNCSCPGLGLGLSRDYQEFPSLSLGLKIETDFSESLSRKLRLTFKSLVLEN